VDFIVLSLIFPMALYPTLHRRARWLKGNPDVSGLQNLETGDFKFVICLMALYRTRLRRARWFKGNPDMSGLQNLETGGF
jgi:hypothetical protein